ncbi:MAG: TetR/AcrR family transcriptional regulator, partial [Betaproteobacteria bacterium]|nr:TetR/AcrR family transcriptional regulator [Betaproteobacteria bacterium]
MPAPKKPAAPRTTHKVKSKPTSYHHGNLREALLEAGLELLRKDGAESLGLRELARQAGVSRTAPYRHFESKEALI